MASQPCHIVNQDYGLAGLSSQAFTKHGILIPCTLISKRAAFTLLENTAPNVETSTIKGRK
jgi:hypothetical protein